MKGISVKLKQDRPLYSVDLRNHGNSGHSADMSYDAHAEDVKEFLLQNDIETAVLIGHSLGGRAVMAAALKYPELVHRLMVVDMAPSNLEKPSEKSLGEAAAVGQAMARLPLAQVSSRAHADDLLSQEVTDPSVRAFALQNLQPVKGGSPPWKWRLNLEVLNNSRATMAKFELGGMPMPYQGPTEFLRGNKSDYVVPERHGTLIRALFPFATISELDAGHWVHAEKPAEFITKVVDFVK
jgi:pimeloyl-ACP methyl ester carboxylesterase